MASDPYVQLSPNVPMCSRTWAVAKISSGAKHTQQVKPCEEPGEEDEQDELISPLAGVSDVEVKGDGQFATRLRVVS